MNSKNFADFGSPAPARYEAAFGVTPVSLPGASILLLHQALNQLSNCIRSDQFESQIGIRQIEAEKLFAEFDLWINQHPVDADGVILLGDSVGSTNSHFKRVFSATEIRALRNALEVVMLDLGQNEFFTCTGFSLAEAKLLLDQLNALFLDPLQLKISAQGTAH